MRVLLLYGQYINAIDAEVFHVSTKFRAKANQNCCIFIQTDSPTTSVLKYLKIL